MRYKINCIIISCLVGLALLVIVINVHEIRELRRSLNNRAQLQDVTITTKSTDHHVITTQTRNAWVYPENVSMLIT